MNASLLAKIAGWMQFATQTVVQVSTVGVPQGVGGWAAMIIGLASAVGIHAASNTAGPTVK